MNRLINRHRSEGFTFIELLVVVGLIAVLASMVVPFLSDEDRSRLMAASAVLSSDIEMAQSMTIANPQTPYCVRFDPDKGQWWIALTKAAETPIVSSETMEPYLVTIGSGRASAAAGVTFSLNQIGGNVLGFDARGGLAVFTAQPSVQFGLGDQAITLAVNPNTGTVTETYGSASKSK